MKKIKHHFLSCILIFVSFFSMAQQDKIDSLNNVLKTVKGDTSEIKALNELSRMYANIGTYEKAIQLAQQALNQSEKLNFKKGAAAAYNNIGIVYWNKGNFDKAMEIFLESFKIHREINDQHGMANCYNNIGLVYWNQGNYGMAVQNLLNSLEIWEKIGNKNGQGMAYLNIGNIYLNQDNQEKALEFYYKSLKINSENGNKIFEATNLNNIGIIYGYLRDYEKSLSNHLQALKIREEIKDKKGIAMSYNNLGLIYEDQGQYKTALDYQMKSQLINKEIGNKQGVAVSYNNIGKIYIHQGKFDDALYYNILALNLCKSIGYKLGIKDTYSSLSLLFEKKGDFKQAFIYHSLFSDIKDTLLNEESGKQIAEMNTKYDSEKKDKELIKKDAEISKQLAETEKQNLQRNAFIIGFALVMVLALFIFKGYRQKKNSNELLAEKNNLIEGQKQLVEEKNIKITDSINYAKRIQQAILPSFDRIRLFIPELFIFFKPKDIVSGDFYWFTEKQDKLIIAVADCTGHGVPGAFMSMIGNTLLNEIINVKNISDPAQILNLLNKGIVKILHQNGNDSNTQDDGMDITILAIDKISNEIEFAGANHFLYFISKTKIETFNGDVFSIGGMFGNEDINFSNQKIKVENGDRIYLFTDGFIDQFGGEKNTKFLSTRFEQLLQNIQQHNMQSQHEKLSTAFDNWQGNNKQLDDVLIVGIQF